MNTTVSLFLLLLILANRTIFSQNVEDLPPIDKRDEVLAYLFNYGDPNFEYPSIMKLSKLKEMMDDLVKMVRRHYKNPVVYKVAKLIFDGPLITDQECQKATGPASRAGSSQIKRMNEHRFRAKDYRGLFQVLLSDAANPDTKYDIPTVTCYLNLWMEKTIEKYPEKEGVRERVSAHIHKVFDRVIDYLKTLSLDQIDDCDFRAIPRDGYLARFKSIQLNLLEVVDNLTTKSKTKLAMTNLKITSPRDVNKPKDVDQ